MSQSRMEKVLTACFIFIVSLPGSGVSLAKYCFWGGRVGVLFLIPDLKKSCQSFRKFLGLKVDYVGTYR